MRKQHHQSKAEQIYNEAHGAGPFHHRKNNDKMAKSSGLENIDEKLLMKHAALRFLAIKHQ